ncbi:MAG: hypothetical protein KGJ84_18025, partial [Elusimicrobia bacterium]|nr:hypothetical protein [Elusimicrobiota bacterium]
SAAKDIADAKAAGPGGGGGGDGGGGSAGPVNASSDPGAKDVTAATPLVGVPQVPDGEKAPDLYANKHGGPRVVPVFDVKNDAKKVVAVTFTGKMSIDADGAGDAYKTDKTGQSQTSAKIAGASLNPLRIPFAVKPTGFGHGVHLLDYAAVSYHQKTVFTVVGDNGPQDEVGECSMSCAKSLDIDSNPNSGGVDGGVTYTFLPGSRDAAPPTSADDIQARGRAKFQAAGIKVPGY